MDAQFTLPQILATARRLKRAVTGLVIFGNDSVAMVEAGPRGGWRVIA